VLPNTKALLAFAGRFLLIFIFILPLWFLLTPAYNRLLASSANIVLSLVEDPHVTTLVGWRRNIAIVRAETPFRKGVKVQGFTGYLTHFNFILMTALVLAPRRIDWRRRCKVLAIALGILFVTHLLYLLIGLKFFQQPELEAFQSLAGRLYVWGLNLYLSVASQLFPVLIWMALYRTVRSIPGRGPVPESENAPEGDTGESDPNSSKNVYLVGLRQRHHASHSGYERFSRYVGTTLKPPLNFRRGSGALAGLVNRVVTAVTRHPRYSIGALLTEGAAAFHMLRHRDALYHVIYGDSDLWLLGYARLRTRNRLVATFHEPPAFLERFAIDRQRTKNLDAVVLVAESQRVHFEGLLPPWRVFVVPHGVDTDFFCPPERISDQQVCIAVGGKLRDFETFTLAINLIWRVDPSVRFVLVGTPHTKDAHLRRLRDERVHFRRGLSDEELRRAYQTSKLAVFSFRDSTVNNALLEAMACGLPIVATDVGGTRQYLGGESGVLCPPGDADALAAGVLQVLADPALATRMAAASRARALGYHYRIVADQLRQVYSKVLLTGHD